MGFQDQRLVMIKEFPLQKHVRDSERFSALAFNLKLTVNFS